MLQDTELTLKEQFENKINKLLKGSVDLTTNEFGSKFQLPHTNTIASWKKTKEIKIPNMLDFINGRNEPPKYEMITVKNFGKYFDTERYSFDELCIDFEALKKNINKAKSEKVNNQSDASMALASIGEDEEKIQYKSETYPFFSDIGVGLKYTKADDEFLFNNLYKDEGNNLYWKLGDKLYLLNFKQNGERELVGSTNNEETQFWPAFIALYGKKFDEWNKKITSICQEYNWNETHTPIETILMDNGIPRLYLECLELKTTKKGLERIDSKGRKEIVWYTESAKASVMGYNKRYTHTDFTSVLSKNIMVPVDVTRLKTIPTYSNNRNEVAVKYLDLPTCSNPKEEPKLPPMWDKFLGNGRFFNPRMDKMKIATFVTNALNAKYSGRQVLCLGGTGEDGKGVFLHILDLILGTEHTANVPFSAFEASDQFGLSSVINKKFVYLSDCKALSKLFASDKFKQLTGHDKISINRKNMDFFSYVPKGTVFAAVTNNSFYVNDTHGKSRVMPVVFRKNFENKDIIDKNEMEEKLYAEKEDFLQWCVDYRYWLNKMCNGNLLRGTQLIMCCDEDLKYVAKGEIDDNKLFKNMCETEVLNGRPFCSWNDYEETDDDDDVYMPMFEECFIFTNKEEDFITTEDMRKTLEKFVSSHHEFLGCFTIKKYDDDYTIEYMHKDQRWWRWCQFLTAKMELIKRKNSKLNRWCWYKVKIREHNNPEILDLTKKSTKKLPDILNQLV